MFLRKHIEELLAVTPNPSVDDLLTLMDEEVRRRSNMSPSRYLGNLDARDAEVLDAYLLRKVDGRSPSSVIRAADNFSALVQRDREETTRIAEIIAKCAAMRKGKQTEC